MAAIYHSQRLAHRPSLDPNLRDTKTAQGCITESSTITEPINSFYKVLYILFQTKHFFMENMENIPVRIRPKLKFHHCQQRVIPGRKSSTAPVLRGFATFLSRCPSGALTAQMMWTTPNFHTSIIPHINSGVRLDDPFGMSISS